MPTANEMKFKMEAQIDAIASNESPAISDEQASEFLNNGLHVIMKRLIRQGIEANEYNRQFTAPLKKGFESTPSTNQSNPHNNGQFWDLPEDFYLMASEWVDTDKRWCVDGNIIQAQIQPVSEDYVKANESNPQRKPFCDEEGCRSLVWRLTFGRANLDEDSNKFSELITDGTFNVSKYFFRYLAKPKEIVVNLTNPDEQINSDIYKEFHDDIIFEAALHAIENMGIMSKFEAKAILNQKQEIN